MSWSTERRDQEERGRKNKGAGLRGDIGRAEGMLASSIASKAKQSKVQSRVYRPRQGRRRKDSPLRGASCSNWRLLPVRPRRPLLSDFLCSSLISAVQHSEPQDVKMPQRLLVLLSCRPTESHRTPSHLRILHRIKIPSRTAKQLEGLLSAPPPTSTTRRHLTRRIVHLRHTYRQPHSPSAAQRQDGKSENWLDAARKSSRDRETENNRPLCGQVPALNPEAARVLFVLPGRHWRSRAFPSLSFSVPLARGQWVTELRAKKGKRSRHGGR